MTKSKPLEWLKKSKVVTQVLHKSVQVKPTHKQEEAVERQPLFFGYITQFESRLFLVKH